MNWDTIEGKWEQFTGKVKTKWGKLTDDDLNQIKGRKDELVGRVRERYGMARDEAERQVDEWISKV
ncbi:MAG: CsbD family protein [Polyangiales bacterium]